MKSALITGITGQDGAYLAELLLRKNYKVFGIYRRISTPSFWRLQDLGVQDRITLIPADLADTGSIVNAILESNPDEVYHLAAQSFVEASFDQPASTGDITGVSVTRILDVLKLLKKDARFYQASSSEMYGDGSFEFQNEETPFHPASPYAAAKVYAYWLTRIYRESFGMFSCNGILFNHESPLRGLEFVTRKVTNAVAMIKLGVAKSVHLGNLDAKRDWGFAPEYVESMWKILQNDKPNDFVIATGTQHSVRELVELAFSDAGLDWKDHVVIDRKLLRPLDVPALKGDSAKAARELGWKPKTSFSGLVKLMVDADIQRWRKSLDGEIFPWDIPSSINIENKKEYLVGSDIDKGNSSKSM
jgi:GDPmannose 4,6-dehydratase